MKLNTSNIESFDVSDLLALDEEDINAALAEAMDVVVDSVRRKGEEMKVHDTGDMLNSLTPGKVKRYPSGDYGISATFKGSRKSGKGKSGKPLRNSEVAFMNEFGVKGQGERRETKARPFVSEGNEAAADEVAEIIQRNLYGDKK